MMYINFMMIISWGPLPVWVKKMKGLEYGFQNIYKSLGGDCELGSWDRFEFSQLRNLKSLAKVEHF